MPNSREKQILSEGFKNAVVSLSGVLTVSDENWPSAIRLADFLQNDSRMGTLVGLRVDFIEFSATDPMVLIPAWNSDSPQIIGTYSQSGEVDYLTRGGGKQPDRNRSGYDGSINVSTQGFVAGHNTGYMITLTMTKLYA